MIEKVVIVRESTMDEHGLPIVGAGVDYTKVGPGMIECGAGVFF